MQEVAPEGMKFDPTEDRTLIALGEGDTPTTVKGVYKREGSAAPTVSPRPSSIVKPTPPTPPSDPKPTAAEKAEAARRAEEQRVQEEARRKEEARLAAKRRRKKKVELKKENLAARSINPYDIDPAAINKGGLMTKGKKKK